MPGENLTRDEAGDARRASSPSSPTTSTLDLTTGPADVRVDDHGDGSTAASRARATFIDLIAPTVRAVTLNGAALDPADGRSTGTRIALAGLAADNELRVVADCAYMHTGEGLHRFVDPVDEEVYLYTQFETADARRVFAVLRAARPQGDVPRSP